MSSERKWVLTENIIENKPHWPKRNEKIARGLRSIHLFISAYSNPLRGFNALQSLYFAHFLVTKGTSPAQFFLVTSALTDFSLFDIVCLALIGKSSSHWFSQILCSLNLSTRIPPLFDSVRELDRVYRLVGLSITILSWLYRSVPPIGIFKRDW